MESQKTTRRPRIGEYQVKHTKLTWDMVEAYVRNGIAEVYFRNEKYRVVMHKNRFAIVEADSGVIVQIGLDRRSYPPTYYYLIRGAAKSEVKPVESNDVPKYEFMDKLQVYLKCHERKRKREEMFYEASRNTAGQKRQGRANSHADIGKYANWRHNFTLEEYTRTCNRLKMYQEAAQFAARARKREREQKQKQTI